ncbi:zf-HC2 domain-containing protein [Pandoraea anhela]|uniref:Putative transmembrane anti-sigma factor n=1 Tax=Pandoraea anhela TaxID=2508295 RepID=A0A5E4UBG8_9BURK|nr:zf-HC2 domain-containing protein [Pandoraea anhela]VVD97013.1 putative transmembrane anti-sigma factor [Pandoraea anhela]
MNEDDIRLLAYVDGALPAAERAEVEAAIAASPELADAVESLQASRLPYRETFAAHAIPPVPESLTASLDALLRAHAQRQAPVPPQMPLSAKADSADSKVDSRGTHQATDPIASVGAVQADASRNVPAANDAPVGRRVRPWWLAAAFAAGVAATAITLPLLSGVLNPGGAGGFMTASVSSKPEPGRTWVRAAAEYQQLYARDTVASIRVDDSDTQRTVSDIRQNDKLDISVPDLRSQGLTFKRVQRLRWKDSTLVQMVYLPATGDPVALCVVRDARPDQGVAEQKVDSMGVVTWRKGQIGYALIGAPGSTDLKAIAKTLADGVVTPLYGMLTSPDLRPDRAAS